MWFFQQVEDIQRLADGDEHFEERSQVVPRRKQQGDVDLEFVELEDTLVDKARNIPERNVKSKVALPIPTELRRSTKKTKAPEIYSPTLHCLLLIDSGEPEYYDEAL